MIKLRKAFSGFSTDNLDKTKQFYSETLGVKVENGPMGILELHTEGNQPIIIYPKPDHVPATFTVLNFLVDDIEKAVDELIAKEVVFEQYGGNIQTNEKGICRESGGPVIAWFKDPAGNILSLIEEK